MAGGRGGKGSGFSPEGGSRDGRRPPAVWTCSVEAAQLGVGWSHTQNRGLSARASCLLMDQRGLTLVSCEAKRPRASDFPPLCLSCNQGRFCLQRTFGDVWGHFWWSHLGERGLLASSEQRPGVLLNPTMQGTAPRQRTTRPNTPPAFQASALVFWFRRHPPDPSPHTFHVFVQTFPSRGDLF